MRYQQSRGGERVRSAETRQHAKPFDLLIFVCPNQKDLHHSLQDAISLSPCQTKQPNISISLLSASLSSYFAADHWTCVGVTTPEKEWESAGIWNAPSQAKPVISL